MVAVSADGEPCVQTVAPSCRSVGGLKTDTVGGIFLLNAYDYMTSIFLPLRPKKERKKRRGKKKKKKKERERERKKEEEEQLDL